MIRSQGKYFSVEELDRIVGLLRDTDMSLTDIACRMRCSRSAVAAINRKMQIRVYAGRRSQWIVNLDQIAPIAEVIETTQAVRDDKSIDRRTPNMFSCRSS